MLHNRMYLGEIVHKGKSFPGQHQAILAGQQHRCMSLLCFQRNPLPTDWLAQRAVVAGFDA